MGNTYCSKLKLKKRSQKFSSCDVFKIIYLLVVAPACLLPQQWSFGTNGGSCPNTSGFIAPWSPPPHGERGVVVWIGARDIGAATPSLVIWEAGEGSEAGYLIKADWDFH